MIIATKPTTRWFVYGFYMISSPQLEKTLIKYACDELLDCTVDEKDLPKLEGLIECKQQEEWEKNKRLKRVEISFAKNQMLKDEATLYIGQQCLRLRKVKANILDIINT